MIRAPLNAICWKVAIATLTLSLAKAITHSPSSAAVLAGAGQVRRHLLLHQLSAFAGSVGLAVDIYVNTLAAANLYIDVRVRLLRGHRRNGWGLRIWCINIDFHGWLAFRLFDRRRRLTADHCRRKQPQ
jgi:hypothetical protein